MTEFEAHSKHFSMNLTENDKQENETKAAKTEASSELLASMDITDEFNGVDPDVIPDATFKKAEEAIKTFEELQQEFNGRITAATIDAMFPSQDDRDNYLKRSAGRLYQNIHKAAKLFLKDWCIVNNYHQRWTNPFEREFNIKRVDINSKFIPKIYNLQIVSTVTEEIRLLADMMYTAREACIEGAKKLGFDHSLHRQKVFASFDTLTIKELTENPKWLAEQRLMHIFDEHLDQILKFRYVSLTLKDKWKREVEEKRKNVDISRII